MLKTVIKEQLADFVISPGLTISEAFARLNAAGIGALVVCSADHKLCGILTDGDLRRAMIKARPLETLCGTIATTNPIVASPSTTRLQALTLMNQHDVDHLPIVDKQGILQDLLLRRDLIVGDEIESFASELLDSVMLRPSASITEAIAELDKAGTGALVLCNQDRILIGLLTDGDIRRAILRGLAMDTACESIASREPLTVTSSMSTGEALELMVKHDINHLPVVDGTGRVLRFLLRKNLVQQGSADLSAVIMAGGYGKRLLPLTERVPKPMLLVGDKPLLELTIQLLRRSGIRDISLTTHYLPENIVQYFGDGSAFGVRLNYLEEDRPLGTAGGLRLMKRNNNPFLVINGDIITGVPFQEMLNFHREHNALLTVGVRKYEVEVPFGVVELDEVHINRIQEKPSFSFFINAGTYLLEPEVCDFIPSGRRFDMTDLIQKLIEAGKVVVSFPITEYWLDVGRHEDYAKAQEDVRNGVI
jgi:dTDP-glucose pyrophosphorylase/CBS-domain-containing membrane protein